MKEQLTTIRPVKDSCKFAHRKDELQDLPDLACTKLCDSAAFAYGQIRAAYGAL